MRNGEQQPTRMGAQDSERAEPSVDRDEEIQVGHVAQADVAEERAGHRGALQKDHRDSRATERSEDPLELGKAIRVSGDVLDVERATPVTRLHGRLVEGPDVIERTEAAVD